ncbi:MAG: hypothetical protein LLG02_15040 [Pelosinus sp.]|nr:hypothetical protein [Pelosinus sp.]
MTRYIAGCLLACFLLIAGLPVGLAQGERGGSKKPVIISQGTEKIAAGTAIVDENELWLPVELLKYINSDLVFDQQDKKIYWYINQPQFKLETPELDARLEDGLTINLPVNLIEGVYYVNVRGLEKLLGMQTSVDNSGNVALGVGVKYKDNYLSRVRSANQWNSKVNLVWDVKGTAAALHKEDKINGLNVLAPTWFSIISDSGLIANKAEAEYVAAAHKKGYKVWALVNNGFDPNITHTILYSPAAREKVINQLVFYAALYQLDGINIDFENIYDDDKDQLSDFIGEISGILKQQNLTLSIDVTVPANVSFWSKCYDRKKLAEITDYVMVMTYDEYWASSPVSGPVASLGWVESSLQKTLKEVPKQKLLMGIPFYTRQWAESDIDGTIKAKSKTMSMMDVESCIKERNLEVVWVDDKGLNYTEYYTDDKRYRIWIEDERSLTLKTSLVDKYDLAGIAAWRKGFERPEIWQVLKSTLPKPAGK